MARNENRLDRISKLQDSILIRILSSLPFKDSVSTSILSTRWRHLFVSVFNLDVDLNIDWSSPHTVKSFRDMMDKMLFFHTEGKIEQFRLNHVDISESDSLCVCRWVAAALWRGVKELDLGFDSICCSVIPIVLPMNVLFVSQVLVRLKLKIPFLVTVPNHVDLPSLKTLDLQYIEFGDDGSVKRLLSGCPILEDLSISNCVMRNMERLKILIRSPSLVCFKYVGLLKENFLIVNMPSLVRADINISAEYHPSAAFYREHGAVKLFEGIGNVKSLYLTIYSGALPFLSKKSFLAFENLLQLEISDKWQWEVQELFKFIEMSPNLQTLVICKVSKEVSVPKGKVPSCVLYQLKEFKVLDFDNWSSLFKMVAYILNNATTLEKLTIKHPTLKYKEKFSVIQQLLRLPKCSNKCHVEAF